jgi:hypothetical protein
MKMMIRAKTKKKEMRVKSMMKRSLKRLLKKYLTMQPFAFRKCGVDTTHAKYLNTIYACYRQDSCKKVIFMTIKTTILTDNNWVI